MLMRVVVKSPLRRRASRSALVKLFAPKGGGIGRMFVSRAAFFCVYFKPYVRLPRRIFDVYF